MEPIIKVEGLGKKYVIRHEQQERYTALRDVMARNVKKIFSFPQHLRAGKPSAQYEEFWALKDLNFEIQQGDRVGIIGRNGAGKSTLLKILSRITEPSTGRIELNGRVASLLEVGTGFHPELTGRENIYLNGAILGMSRAEIRKKFDEIVNFSGVEKFLDTPVKRYSSGMYVRLAFAVAAHLEPEILVVDEVLAVGDAEFQKKCLGKMEDISKNEGRTIIFVSHDLGAIVNLTSKAVFLQSGEINSIGGTLSVVDNYNNINFNNEEYAEISMFKRGRYHDDLVVIEKIWIDEKNKFNFNDDILIKIKIFAKKPISNAMADFLIKNSIGNRILNHCSWDSNYFINLNPGYNILEVLIKNHPFTEGRYTIDLGINQSPNSNAFDVVLGYPIFEVVNKNFITNWSDRDWGIIHLNNIVWSKSYEK